MLQKKRPGVGLSCGDVVHNAQIQAVRAEAAALLYETWERHRRGNGVTYREPCRTGRWCLPSSYKHGVVGVFCASRIIIILFFFGRVCDFCDVNHN